MKKIIIALTMCLTFVNVAKAECWGKEITGKNGHVYCLSNQTMKWYAALGWCAAQNRHLVTLNEACDYGTQIYGTSTENCPNIEFNTGVYFDKDGNDLKGRQCFTSIPYGDNRVRKVYLGINGFPETVCYRADLRNALCY